MKKWIFESELEKNPAPHRAPVVTRWGAAIKGKREKEYVADLSKRILESNMPILEDGETYFGEEALSIKYTFGFMPAKSWSKKKKEDAFSGRYVLAKPDTDNVAKATTDVLMDVGIILDDQYIVRYDKMEKIYTETPFIRIEITTIPPDEYSKNINS